MLKMVLLDCAINEKCCSVDGGQGICPLFSSPPRGIWQLKSSHPREFAIQDKKRLMPRGQPGGGGGTLGAAGIDWCIISELFLTYEETCALYAWLFCQNWMRISRFHPCRESLQRWKSQLTKALSWAVIITWLQQIDFNCFPTGFEISRKAFVASPANTLYESPRIRRCQYSSSKSLRRVVSEE